MAPALFHIARRRSRRSPDRSGLPANQHRIQRRPAELQWPADIFSRLSIFSRASRILRPELTRILFLLRQNFRRASALPQLQNVDEKHPGEIEKQRSAEAAESGWKVSTPLELLRRKKSDGGLRYINQSSVFVSAVPYYIRS